jgi:hypothetical protein
MKVLTCADQKVCCFHREYDKYTFITGMPTRQAIANETRLYDLDNILFPTMASFGRTHSMIKMVELQRGAVEGPRSSMIDASKAIQTEQRRSKVGSVWDG